MSRATLPGKLLEWAERKPDEVFIEVWDDEEGVGVTTRLTYRELASSMLSAVQWLRAAAMCTCPRTMPPPIGSTPGARAVPPADKAAVVWIFAPAVPARCRLRWSRTRSSRRAT